MKFFIGIFMIVMANSIMAQVEKVEPPNWWVGFTDNSLQLLIKGEGIGQATPEIDYKGVTITGVTSGDSPNYLFIELTIDKDTKPGSFKIVFKVDKRKKYTYEYTLLQRIRPAEDFIGFDGADVIYLITPDRFANGDPSYDIVKGLKEQGVDRNNDYARHGGDIKGITEHLDYIHDMGFTAIWPTPVLTNDMPRTSYHGYAMTDFYEVDPRFGTLNDYKELSDKARQRGIKLIMDQVANHCGSEHWWMKDLPFKDWVNYQEDFAEHKPLNTSNHRRTTNQDPYASKFDKDLMHKGWFVSAMPDLNQRNPFMARYIIQNSIWWIETLGLGGIRQDTYPYSDKDFMAIWAGAIMNEYPNFNIVGEEWSYNPLLVGYWQQGAKNKDGYQSNLKSTMDFPMQRKIVEALNETEGWDTGLVKIYEGLANDFYYANPQLIMAFADNHDMDRIFTQLNKDFTNTKIALGYLLVLPRIVQIYYGTEVLLENSDKPGDHGLIRKDFPGGWPGDTVNAFTGEGLSVAQLEMQQFLKKVLNYRKTSEAIHKGKTVHFAPENGIYVLARIYDNETVLAILNKNQNQASLSLDRFKELGLSGKEVRNIITGARFIVDKELILSEKGIVLLTTKL